jgi:type IV pilus assembly protein PilE
MPTDRGASTTRIEAQDMNNRHRPTPRLAGFSLIELMIVVAVVAILATIATQSYRRYTMRANRTDAKNVLLQIQVAQEKYFLQNNSYVTALANIAAAPPAGLGIAVNAGTGTTLSGNYSIAFTAATPTSYTVTATAIGGQAADTTCATLSVDQSGQKTSTPSASCW